MLDDLTGVVLAGGDSTRFSGTDKALAEYGGQPLLATVVERVERATGCPPVVAAGTRQRAARYGDLLPERVRFAADAEGFDGPLAGILGGFGTVDAEWALVVGCDMPGLGPAAVRWLAASREPAVDAVAVSREPDVVAVSRGARIREPLHALYRVEPALAVAEELVETDGPQALLDALDVNDLDPGAAPDDVELARSLANVNTRADLLELERHR